MWSETVGEAENPMRKLGADLEVAEDRRADPQEWCGIKMMRQAYV